MTKDQICWHSNLVWCSSLCLVRQAAQGCGDSTVSQTHKDPSISPPHPPVVWFPFQVCPVAQQGCWSSSHHPYVPGSWKEKGMHAVRHRAIFESAVPHFLSPLTDQNLVPVAGTVCNEAGKCRCLVLCCLK